VATARRRSKADARVPASASSFVGRRAELARIASTFAARTRLVTLVGPPGTGKTRLALSYAEQEAAAGRAVAFVELSAARTDEELLAAVARTLDVRLSGTLGRDAAIDRIGSVLVKRGALLLVLDNLEQLLGAAHILSHWLARAPKLSLLATSRELLRIAGETAIEVPPLGLPSDVEGLTAAEILASESVALLVARASGYAAPEDDAPILAALARRLEGVPLALELAASRLPLVGARALSEMLGEREAPLDVLAHGRRDAPARQASLRGAIEWSWSLLDAEERRALAWLSLFRGHFAVDTAIAILGPDRARALALVQSLRDKSLLARGPTEARARLLESVRAFAAEKLAADDTRELAAERMSAHVAERAGKQRRARSGREARTAQAWLAMEADTLAAALDASATLALDARRAADRAELVLAMHEVTRRLGPSGRDELALAGVEALSARVSAELSAELSLASASLLRDRGDLDRAAAVLEAAASGASGPLSSRILSALGEMLLASGRFEPAGRVLEGALAKSADDRESAMRAHAAMGLYRHGRGALEQAEEHYATSLDHATALGDARAMSSAHRDLGNLALQRGQLDRARAHYEDALAGSPGDDLRLEGVVRGNLGILRQEQGDLDQALVELRRARECLRTVGDRPFEAHLSGYLGAVQHERGQPDAAREAYGEAIDILREVGDVRLEGVFLAARASVLADKGLVGHAENDLALAARRIAEVGDAALDTVLAAHRAIVELASSARDASTAARALEGARAAITRAESVAARSDDVRFALRMLRRALPADGLEVALDASWFVVPGRPRVELASRPTLSRVLDALVIARLESPGSALSWDTLLAAGWPGEKVLPQAAQNRVRVALSTLRTLGLRTALVTEKGGHRLDERLPTRRAS
jgi:predicted ATPase/predicted negative regulator of RcsB-dependent stress response